LIVKKHRFAGAGCCALLILIAATLCLDLFHGIALGQDQVGYSPIYRLRQSLAVAVSRQHSPAAGGYLAYRSVLDVFNRNGFAILDSEPGPHFDVAGWVALLNDGARLDRIIRQAREVAIDDSLPPDIIKANELGLSDYIYWSFHLFGDKISSLYYFFFLIVAATCLLYVLEFRDSPFLLYLMVIFLGELYLLENYAHSVGIEMNTIDNSRLFSGLGLLPCLHILLVLWRHRPPRPFAVAAVAVQSLIIAFLLSCRTEVAWQAALIIAAAAMVALQTILMGKPRKRLIPIGRFAQLWPAAIFAVVVVGYSTLVSLNADQRYAEEPKGHVFWHTALEGIFSSNHPLRDEYVGADFKGNPDDKVYEAVIRDLNARNDATSPIARRLPDGQITIDLMAGWGDYDRLARSLALRIILHHPLAVVVELPAKFARQAMIFYDEVPWQTLQVPAVLVAVGALICLWAGGFGLKAPLGGSIGGLAGLLLLFALATPVITPSRLAIGTLFTYLGAVSIAVPCLAARIFGAIAKPRAQRATAQMEISDRAPKTEPG
jgi:hypothetical protein